MGVNATEHIFVSYSRLDTSSVDRIIDALRGAGYRVWIDRKSILGARLWRTEIAEAIRDANAFLLVLSPHSVASPNILKELTLSDQYDKSIVPLLLAETTIPVEMQYSLSGIQLIDWRSFEAGFEDLCRTLKGLDIECLDPLPATAPPRQPPSAWWRRASGMFGIAAVLAAVLVYAAAWLTPGRTDVPSSLTPLMPVSLLDRGGLGSLGLAGVLAFLAVAFGAFKSLRPAIGRLAPFFLLPVPLAAWKGQPIAALFLTVAALAIGAWWSWRPKKLLSGAALTPTLILLGSVILGVATQYLLARGAAGGSVIGMTPFEDEGGRELVNEQAADLSNRLRRNLSIVFSRAGRDVEPHQFDKETLASWSFERWNADRFRRDGLGLLLRTTVRQCGMIEPGDPRPASYIWFATPYDPGLNSLPEYASARGSDPRALSLHIALQLLTAKRGPVKPDDKSGNAALIKLDDKSRNAALRTIVDEALHIAIINNMTAQKQLAESLYAQANIDTEKVRELLDGFSAGDSACDEAATLNRNAQKANGDSFFRGKT